MTTVLSKEKKSVTFTMTVAEMIDLANVVYNARLGDCDCTVCDAQHTTSNNFIAEINLISELCDDEIKEYHDYLIAKQKKR